MTYTFTAYYNQWTYLLLCKQNSLTQTTTKLKLFFFILLFSALWIITEDVNSMKEHISNHIVNIKYETNWLQLHEVGNWKSFPTVLEESPEVR